MLGRSSGIRNFFGSEFGSGLLLDMRDLRYSDGNHFSLLLEGLYELLELGWKL